VEAQIQDINNESEVNDDFKGKLDNKIYVELTTKIIEINVEMDDKSMSHLKINLKLHKKVNVVD